MPEQQKYTLSHWMNIHPELIEIVEEHDAKIRREALDQILAFAQSRGWDGAVAIITRDFKWANEADGDL